MSNCPDFVHQVQEVERRFSSEWQIVQNGWQDSVAERFHQEAVESITRSLSQYISGIGLGGYGLERLLQQMDSHLQQMESLTQ